MTEVMCDQVAERMAVGEPLGELAEHVSTCASCQGLVAVSSKLGATRHAVDPGLGFSARMTVGAQHLIGVRRRRRLAAGLAATVAAGMLGVFAVAHAPGSTRTAEVRPQPDKPNPTAIQKDDRPPVDDTATDTDDDLAALADFADVDRSARMSADWHRIQKPLRPYQKLLQGVEP